MRPKTVAGLLLCCGVLGCSWHSGGEQNPIEIFIPPQIRITTHVVQAPDGVSLALHRHLPPNGRKGATVLLCHSMGFNSEVWHLNGMSSPAMYLAARGHDVWRLDFRGCGLSGPAPKGTTFEDYALKDIPAAVGYVAETVEKPGVFVIGHGTGGSAALIYLLSAVKPMVNGLVLIGSPLSAHLPPDAIFSDLALAEKCLADPLCRFPSVTVNASPSPPGWESLFYNPGNVRPNVRDALLRRSSEPIPEGVLRQFLRMVETGKLVSPDGKRTYQGELSALRLPLCALCGKADNFAPPSTVRAIFHGAASVDKMFRLFCRANDDAPDYGHLDLLCGDRVEFFVYPTIDQWLQERLKE